MRQPDSFYALLLILSFISCTAVSAFVWRRRDRQGALPVLVFMLAMALWSLFYAIHWLSPTPQQRWFWLNMTYIGALIVPVAFFIFVLIFTQHEKWVTKPLLIFLTLLTLLTFLLLWTDEAHGLFFGGKRTPDSTMFLQGGPVFWLNVGYSYLLVLIGFILLFQMFRQVRSPYRWQVGIILLGASLPWLSNMLSLAGIRPPGLDLTPFFFVLTGVIFTIGLFRTGWLDLVPVARSRLIETMTDGVLVLDTADRIVDINPSAAILFGHQQKAVIGQPLEILLTHWPDELERLRQLPSGREEVQLGDQSPRYYEVQIIPLQNNRQRLTGRLITWHDTSERKMAELEREKLIYELDAYAHTVAHDLKNPLALTIGYGELLAEMHPFTHENQALYLERMQKNGRRMLRIVDELLLLATIIGQDHIPVEPLSMSDLLQSVLDRFEVTIQQTQAEISLPEHFPLVLGYGPWIEEVWANYISNALKYGGKPPHITVGSDASETTGMVRFWVKDNGQGLEPTAQQRLFQEFERLGQKRVQGHGLGLSVVRRIIERLNGQVGVESDLGSGSLFFFILPAVQTNAQTKPASNDTSPPTF